MSGEGCPRKTADAVQDCDASAHQSSPVIAAFKGNCILSIWIAFFTQMDFISVKTPVLKTNLCYLSFKFSSRSLTPNTTNMSVLLRSVETSPSKARGQFFFYIESPGRYYYRKTCWCSLIWNKVFHFEKIYWKLEECCSFDDLHVVTAAFV